jgi:hypothetical protein
VPLSPRSYLDVGFPDLSTKPADWIRQEPGPIGFGLSLQAIPSIRDAAVNWYIGELSAAKTKPTLAAIYNMVRVCAVGARVLAARAVLVESCCEGPFVGFLLDFPISSLKTTFSDCSGAADT